MKLILDKNTTIICDSLDYEGVQIVAEWVRKDFSLVFGEPDDSAGKTTAVIAGSIQKSGIIKKLAEEGRIDIGALQTKNGEQPWEVYGTFLVEAYADGIDQALVICGSDKRGTIYGLLSVSEAIGVTPFVNWSDAKPLHKEQIPLDEKFTGISKEPSVRYRGIFINDEWPAFGNWATKRFGGINADCYAAIFELLLRLRGNYMWPAMWSSNFSMDGPGLKSAELADRLGIVMSTSHHEPCMRTGEEYRLLRGPESIYGDAWDFLSNREGIIRFWEDGLKRNAPFENVITMGMRGERDTAIMAEATLEENIALLKDIIRTQNGLIRKYVNPDLTKVPRQLVLFTEVEKFYYGDENTPGLIDDPELDGITVIFSDNNYGYTRTLPAEDRRGRNGGYGLYYHVDMHGGAYSYEWIGSTYLPRIKDQLKTAYDYGIRNIWVTNVGDLVSQELEVSLIMKMAWDVEKYSRTDENVFETFVRGWTKGIFGGWFDDKDEERILDIIKAYTLMNERCKHEIFKEFTYHPVHFGEAEKLFEACGRVISECDALLENAPEPIKTAFFELVYYPAYGTANLQRTWIACGRNRFLADQNRNTANGWNDVIDDGIKRDADLIERFHALADGKFYGHSLSEHFGFRFWNDSNNQLPGRVYIYPAYKKRMLVSKKDEAWYYDGREYTVRERTVDDFLRPDCDSITLEISCASRLTSHFRIECNSPWLSATPDRGETDETVEITVRADRSLIDPAVVTTGRLVIDDGEDCHVTLDFPVCGTEYYANVCRDTDRCGIPEGAFIFSCGHVAMEAGDHSRLVNRPHYSLKLLEPYGRTGQGLKLFPNTACLKDLKEDEIPFAEYVFISDCDRDIDCTFVFAPSLPVNDSNSQCFIYRINGGEPVTTDTVLDHSRPIFNSPQWVGDNRLNAKLIKTEIKIRKGINSLCYAQTDPNLILERIEMWDKNVPQKESYLGAPAGFRYFS
ncbi:MAG: glycosyl hydrolase 115 family protein [Lachnospiraceae bacterium]|nr:glycosyl hydrolase 115 family protein [Lachnospiraceae bacterium]